MPLPFSFMEVSLYSDELMCCRVFISADDLECSLLCSALHLEYRRGD